VSCMPNSKSTTAPLMLSDDFPEMGGRGGQPPHPVQRVAPRLRSISNSKKPKHVDQVMEQALNAGATIIMPAPRCILGRPPMEGFAILSATFGLFNAPMKKKEAGKNTMLMQLISAAVWRGWACRTLYNAWRC